MQSTREDLDALLTLAATAVRDLYAGHPGRSADCEAVAEKAVTEAVGAGVHHRQIALRAGVSGLLVLRCITDPDLSNAALRAERHHAERYAEQVMDEIRGRALWLYHHDTRKTDVCAALGITRPALDAWIRADAPGRP